MPSSKHLKPQQIAQLKAIPQSWFNMYNLTEVETLLSERFQTTPHQIRHALLANDIEHEWSKTSKSFRRN